MNRSVFSLYLLLLYFFNKLIYSSMFTQDSLFNFNKLLIRGYCFSCETPTKEPMELAVISHIHECLTGNWTRYPSILSSTSKPLGTTDPRIFTNSIGYKKKNMYLFETYTVWKWWKYENKSKTRPHVDNSFLHVTTEMYLASLNINVNDNDNSDY